MSSKYSHYPKALLDYLPPNSMLEPNDAILIDGVMWERIPAWEVSFNPNEPYRVARKGHCMEPYKHKFPSTKITAFVQSRNRLLAELSAGREIRRGYTDEENRSKREGELFKYYQVKFNLDDAYPQ